MFFCGHLAIAIQRGTVNNFLIGGHLFPDGKLRIGENPVFGGNVLDPVVVLNKFAAVVQYIAAWGKVAVLVEPDVPPVCLIIEIVFQFFRDWQVLSRVAA